LAVPNEIGHDQHHRALVDNLAAKLKPVRVLWPVRRRLMLWLALELAILTQTLIATWNRSMARLDNPGYSLQIGFFAIAALIVAAMVLRAAIPGRESNPWQGALAVVLAVSGTAMLFFVPMRTNLSLGEFAEIGRGCAWATCAKGAIPWIALWWAVKRGAPGNGRAAGAMVGAAAMLFSFAIMRLDCGLDEPLHLMTWHLGPVIIVTIISAGAGALWLRTPWRRTSIAR
jgi:hypothetical protein